jgi:3'(2'), 5'-bisphosphate nucleotidase
MNKHLWKTSMAQLAAKLAVQAGEEALNMRRRGDCAHTDKMDGSPLSAADLACHRIVKAGLACTGIRVLSEEDGLHCGSGAQGSGLLWLVDPLDGTRNYIAGGSDFGTSIGLVEDGRPAAGAVYFPAKGKLFVAVPGKAWLLELGRHFYCQPSLQAVLNALPGHDAGRLGLVDGTGVPRVVVSTSRNSKAQQAAVDRLAEVKGGFKLTKADGAAWKMCMVASGMADAYLCAMPTMEWDTAGAHAVLLGAGCGVESLEDGSSLSYGKAGSANPPFLACVPSMSLVGRLTA